MPPTKASGELTNGSCGCRIEMSRLNCEFLCHRWEERSPSNPRDGSGVPAVSDHHVDFESKQVLHCRTVLKHQES